MHDWIFSHGKRLLIEKLNLQKNKLVWFMVFNATFNNISVISCSILLVEETGGPRENNKFVASH